MCAAIIERFHDAYEARVREAPKGHGMDYVYVYLICSKFRGVEMAAEAANRAGLRMDRR